MLIDSHAHLDMKDYDGDLSRVMDQARAAGLSHVITIGIDPESSRKARAIAHEYAYVYFTVGIHPHDAKAFDATAIDVLSQIAVDPKAVAWGEIGLDFYRLHSPKDDQLRLFQQQLERAYDLNLPVIIHDRDAHEDILNLLTKMGKGKGKGVIHCFSGDLALAKAFMDLGYYISIPGTVTYKNAAFIKDVASGIPLERMLVETDCPFLAPVPKRGKRNEPAYVAYTAQEVARLRKIGLEEVARVTTENAKFLFNLP
jgi:TatD DNase family protein